MPRDIHAGTGIHPDYQETDMDYWSICHRLFRPHPGNVQQHQDCSIIRRQSSVASKHWIIDAVLNVKKYWFVQQKANSWQLCFVYPWPRHSRVPLCFWKPLFSTFIGRVPLLVYGTPCSKGSGDSCTLAIRFEEPTSPGVRGGRFFKPVNVVCWLSW